MAVLTEECIVVTPLIGFSVPNINYGPYIRGFFFFKYFDFVLIILLICKCPQNLPLSPEFEINRN